MYILVSCRCAAVIVSVAETECVLVAGRADVALLFSQPPRAYGGGFEANLNRKRKDLKENQCNIRTVTYSQVIVDLMFFSRENWRVCKRLVLGDTSTVSFMGFESLAADCFFALSRPGLVMLVRTFFLLSVTLLAKAKPPSRFLPRLAAGSIAVWDEPVDLGVLFLASTTTTLKNSLNGLCSAPAGPSAWIAASRVGAVLQASQGVVVSLMSRVVSRAHAECRVVGSFCTGSWDVALQGVSRR